MNLTKEYTISHHQIRAQLECIFLIRMEFLNAHIFSLKKEKYEHLKILL